MSSKQLMREVLEVLGPQEAKVPLIFDSPHSGTKYPTDFNFQLPKENLRFAEDTHVQEIFEHASEVGAQLLHALFPRSYIDPNRSIKDIDPEMLEGTWPFEVETSEKARIGIGLIWNHVRSKGAIYERKLSVDEVQYRIDHYWKPYHQSLQNQIESTYEKFGFLLHVNLHSMRNKSLSSDPDRGAERPDVVLGNQNNLTCSESLTKQVANLLENLGYEVAVNFPYSGQILISKYSDASINKNSIQIEINRRLYMNENTREKHSGFPLLKNNMKKFIDQLVELIEPMSRS